MLAGRAWQGEPGVHEPPLRLLRRLQAQHGAQVLARFKELCDTKFGGCKLAFRALDRHGIKRLRPPEFVAEARRLGFDKGAYIYHGVNVQAKKFITENEFEFLEHWRPPKWLTVEADYAAADEVKSQLLKRYKHLVKAW